LINFSLKQFFYKIRYSTRAKQGFLTGDILKIKVIIYSINDIK